MPVSAIFNPISVGDATKDTIGKRHVERHKSGIVPDKRLAERVKKKGAKLAET